MSGRWKGFFWSLNLLATSSEELTLSSTNLMVRTITVSFRSHKKWSSPSLFKQSRVGNSASKMLLLKSLPIENLSFTYQPANYKELSTNMEQLKSKNVWKKWLNIVEIIWRNIKTLSFYVFFFCIPLKKCCKSVFALFGNRKENVDRSMIVTGF